MAYVSRDPFAREELHKSREKDAMCVWCGRRDLPEDHAAPALCHHTHGKVYRFRIEMDGGRFHEDSRTFCSCSCRRSYYE